MAEATNRALPPSDAEYLCVGRFAQEYDGISSLQLDNYTVERVNLFAVPEYERFLEMDKRLDRIIAALPAIKRIFSNPITRLKDVEAVLPVDAVRVIDHSTMRHVAVHTEFWGNVTEETMIPRKLLTTVNEEEYKIYENVAFAQLISKILGYVKENIYLCKNVIYSSRPMNFDLLERKNHLMYFLALGKLHVGYAHTQDSYHPIHSACLEKLVYIDKILRARLHASVYSICKKDKNKLTLKRTNIFRSQKDYKQVYNLLKLFADDEKKREESQNGASTTPEMYADYCTLLSLFSAKHFNFNFNEKESLHFRTLDTTCSFKGWQLHIERLRESGAEALRFTASKDKSYSACLIFPSGELGEDALLRLFAEKHPSDELIAVRHDVRGLPNSVYLNIFDIDSFRRLQQIFLRCMVYADGAHDTCPFCGASLTEFDGRYECERCKTVIERRHCDESDEDYYSTALKDYRLTAAKTAAQDESIKKDAFLRERAEESRLFYRNITPITKNGNPICPKCGKSH